MDWINRMNDALNYVEANLDGDIDPAELARLTHGSFFHFQKVFSYMANVTFSEYVRRRRLTLAAFNLQQTDEKVIDVALKYGYDSPTSFTRAFKQFHQMLPSEAKRQGKVFTAYPPMSFQISVKGVAAMSYRIAEGDAFWVTGVKLETSFRDERCLSEVPEFWQRSWQSDVMRRICAGCPDGTARIYGISAGCGMADPDFDYYIAAVSDQPAGDGLVRYQVPAGTWAVFECIGPMPAAMQQMQQRIMTEWLPVSGYQPGDGPDLEVYEPGDTRSSHYRSEIWFPIKKA